MGRFSRGIVSWCRSEQHCTLSHLYICWIFQKYMILWSMQPRRIYIYIYIYSMYILYNSIYCTCFSTVVMQCLTYIICIGILPMEYTCMKVLCWFTIMVIQYPWESVVLGYNVWWNLTIETTLVTAKMWFSCMFKALFWTDSCSLKGAVPLYMVFSRKHCQWYFAAGRCTGVLILQCSSRFATVEGLGDSFDEWPMSKGETCFATVNWYHVRWNHCLCFS